MTQYRHVYQSVSLRLHDSYPCPPLPVPTPGVALGSRNDWTPREGTRDNFPVTLRRYVNNPTTRCQADLGMTDELHPPPPFTDTLPLTRPARGKRGGTGETRDGDLRLEVPTGEGPRVLEI